MPIVTSPAASADADPTAPPTRAADHGAASVGGEMATPANVAVASSPLLCALTASPARATGGRATATGDPSCVQMAPSVP